MAKIIGIIVVFASVLGGYVLSHGKIGALIQPFEVMIIGGAALGAFLQANPGSTFMHVFKKSLKMFGSRFNHAYYLEILKLLYEILNKSRREGMMAIEADVEDPAASPIFSKYPGILKDAGMTAVNRVADGLPGFGIVAAVLGIVVTMALLGEVAQAELGTHVGAALVGTFLGILAAYGFFGPLSVSLEHDAKEELNVYEAIKATLVSSASGMPPTLAVEFGRKVLFPAHRPSFTELEQAMRGS